MCSTSSALIRSILIILLFQSCNQIDNTNDELREKVQPTITSYYIEYPGSNDIVHILQFIEKQSDANMAGFYLYDRTVNENRWTTKGLMLDAYSLRVIEKNMVESNDVEFTDYFIKTGLHFYKNQVPALEFDHFEFLKPNGEIDSTNSFKNMTLVIDFGASWCGPCKEQYPFLDQTIDQLQARNDIQFLSISLDESQEDWRKLINDQNNYANRIYGFISNHQKDQFKNKFGLNAIPKYFIISKNGNFITYEGPFPNSILFKALILSDSVI